MSELPPTDNEGSMVPPAVRSDFDTWRKTGDDDALTRLIAHLFTSLEIPASDDVLRDKGDAATFTEDLGVDSLTLAEILFYTEDLLSIRIPNEDVAKLKTVGDLKQYLSLHRDDCVLK